MRKAMDMELLQALVTKLQSTFYTSVDMDFCNSLISDAAQSDLADRILWKQPLMLANAHRIVKQTSVKSDFR